MLKGTTMALTLGEADRLIDTLIMEMPHVNGALHAIWNKRCMPVARLHEVDYRVDDEGNVVPCMFRMVVTLSNRVVHRCPKAPTVLEAIIKGRQDWGDHNIEIEEQVPDMGARASVEKKARTMRAEAKARANYGMSLEQLYIYVQRHGELPAKTAV
jgi:hypothetical protein